MSCTGNRPEKRNWKLSRKEKQGWLGVLCRAALEVSSHTTDHAYPSSDVKRS